MNGLEKGDFVQVGTDMGVVVFLEHEEETPAEHLGIWYGETNDRGMPKYRTVPTAYCKKVKSVEVYH